MTYQPAVLVFDVNETLLDLRALDPHFERIFGDAKARVDWFGLVLRNAMALTIIGDYEDFVAVGRASLQMVADQRGVELSSDDPAAIGETMASLPPHPDVAPALQRLFAAGLRLAALTNSPQEAAVSQLTAAGVAPLIETIMSAGAVGKFKPAREVYEMAVARLGVRPAEMTMVAAHDWDVAGAMGAGCRGALVARPGMVMNPLYPEPDVVGPDLSVIADTILDGVCPLRGHAGRSAEVPQEIAYPELDLVTYEPDLLEAAPGGVVEIPFEIALPRIHGTDVTAAHCHDHIGFTDHGIGPELRPTRSNVDPDLAHRGDGGRVDPVAGLRARRKHLDSIATEVLQPPRRHLRAPGVVCAQEEYGRPRHRLHRIEGRLVTSPAARS